jgi:hypothetical protein
MHRRIADSLEEPATDSLPSSRRTTNAIERLQRRVHAQDKSSERPAVRHVAAILFGKRLTKSPSIGKLTS